MQTLAMDFGFTMLLLAGNNYRHRWLIENAGIFSSTKAGFQKNKRRDRPFEEFF
jgi:hypothetical protein